MNEIDAQRQYTAPIRVASSLTILGFVAALLYMWTPGESRWNAATMVLFLAVGVPLMILSVGVFLFELLKDVLARLRAWRWESFKPGEIVFREGDPGDRLYTILSGEAEVLRNGSVIARIGPGEYFGEMALLSGKPRNATIQAVSGLKTVSMETTYFRLLASLPLVREGLERLVRQRQEKHEVGPIL